VEDLELLRGELEGLEGIVGSVGRCVMVESENGENEYPFDGGQTQYADGPRKSIYPHEIFLTGMSNGMV